MRINSSHLKTISYVGINKGIDSRTFLKQLFNSTTSWTFQHFKTYTLLKLTPFHQVYHICYSFNIITNAAQ